MSSVDDRPDGVLLASTAGEAHSSGSPTAKNRHGPVPSNDLVVARNFIRAVRESGYISLSTALAELIDNSLQAGATAIDISITRPTTADPPEIAVTDNGVGMNRGELEACLQFGGTPRFDDRQSFGRFGMGLPAASLSQSRRIEVVAWQGGGTAREVILDVDEIVAGATARLRAKRSTYVGATASGCTVAWRQCDRIEYQRLAWLERALHRDLGRAYRRFVSAGLKLSINRSRVKARDPLLLHGPVEGQTASLAFEPQRYEVATAEGGTSFVDVRFSMLPVHAWHDLDNVAKRRADIVGGGGVSILRAGREIAFGWHLMGAKRKENYDDWWRCEIEFEPALDEHFGITINKQGIRPSTQLREALEPELETVARLLNTRVRQAFEEIKFRAATDTSCRIAEAADPHLPVIARKRRRPSAGALAYRLTSGPLPSGMMLATNLDQRTLEVTLNVDHPAFTALYGPLQSLADESGGSPLRTAIELLILSFARTFVSSDQADTLRDVLTTWSATYARMLQKT
jgi:Histidine kinase-, DNA gyrase B-, and HSP90-like ATPase